MANQSDFEFVLLGFPGLQPPFHILVSFVLFIAYLIALFANGSVIILIFLKEQLHQPMYIIIGNLAFSDLLFDTITLPKIIAAYWFGAGSISFYLCMLQMFLVHCLGALDSFILMLMAIDRYIAICKPLRYCSIITNKFVAILCSFFWLLSAIISFIIISGTARLTYCGPNKVENCFCHNTMVSLLACGESAIVRRVGFILSIFVHLVPLSFIIFSYIIIIRTVRSSSRSESWQKAFYTCITHLFVISLYYIPRMTVYAYNQVLVISISDINVLIVSLYTYVPHLASPVIYCLRTKEIKSTFGNIFKKKISIKNQKWPMIP
ncbi:olfactory receptor 52K1-like [Discoglossus pictus]